MDEVLYFSLLLGMISLTYPVGCLDSAFLSDSLNIVGHKIFFCQMLNISTMFLTLFFAPCMVYFLMGKVYWRVYLHAVILNFFNTESNIVVNVC